MKMNEKPVVERRYLKTPEIKAAYGLGYKAIRTLVRERRLTRRKVGNAWRYPVHELEMIFSERQIRRHIPKGYGSASKRNMETANETGMEA